nr:SDR family oxidoreductase [Halomarina sp. PSR21]
MPSSRFGQPDDVADVAVFLASDLSGYVNGESIVVNEGLLDTSSGPFASVRLRPREARVK